MINNWIINVHKVYLIGKVASCRGKLSQVCRVNCHPRESDEYEICFCRKIYATIFVCLFIYWTFFCLYICWTFFCLFICLNIFVCLFIHLNIFVCLYISVNNICLFFSDRRTSAFVRLSGYLSVCPSGRISVRLSVCRHACKRNSLAGLEHFFTH